MKLSKEQMDRDINTLKVITEHHPLNFGNMNYKPETIQTPTVVKGAKYSVLPYCVQLKALRHFGFEVGRGTYVVLRESSSNTGYVLENINGEPIMLGLETPELKTYRLAHTVVELGYDLKVQQIVYDIYRQRRAAGESSLENTISVFDIAARAGRMAKRTQELVQS